MENKFKFNTFIFILLAIPFFQASCSSSRVLNSPYNKVAEVAKKEFYQNNWTKKSTKRATIEEWDNGLEIKLHEWEFPNVKIYCEIEVVRKSDNLTKLYVYIQDCNSWWWPFNFNPQMATDVLDSFEKQLKWYKFGSMEKPWDKLNEEK